jgi:hypothetical protein
MVLYDDYEKAGFFMLHGKKIKALRSDNFIYSLACFSSLFRF